MEGMWALEVEKVSYRYGERQVLQDVSLRVAEHTIHGLLGPNGAGKTTLLKIITSLMAMHEGSVRILGHDIRQAFKATRNLVGFLPEVPPLYPQQTVRDYLNFVAQLHGKKLFPLAAADQELLERLGLLPLLGRLIGHLSKGQQQRVGLGQALIYHPSLLILDEPLVGLDPTALAEIRSLLLALKKDHTIFISSHQLHDLELMASAATIIGQGKILASGPLEQIREQFSGQQVLRVKVKSWPPEMTSRLAQELNLQAQVMAQDATETLLQITGPQVKEQQERVAQFCLTQHLGLMSLTEEELDLETLFQKITQTKNAAVVTAS